MGCRDETFTLLGSAERPARRRGPRARARATERICRTVHGPVQARGGDVAYARRYAIWGRELETLEGLAAVNARARTSATSDGRRASSPGTRTCMAADSAGNIGYWHPGLMQLRPARWDERLPLPGTGEAEWRGSCSRSRAAAGHQPQAGLAGQLEQHPVAGLDHRRRGEETNEGDLTAASSCGGSSLPRPRSAELRRG